MQVQPGDQIRVRGRRTGQPDRTGQILEVRGLDGAPPYRVRWDDSGHEVLFFPGTDAMVEHLEGHVLT
jgi:hypothetical protein